MSNLLDRASVVLTPTAYNNGEALCVKPDDASGDFQFSRNSAATRVNAQGLVEDVQILSGNLVQNGDFSNGSTDWSVGTGWSIGDGVAITDGSQTGVSGWLRQNSILTVGKTYNFSCSIVTSDTGRVAVANDTNSDIISFDNGSGEYTTTFTALGSSLAIAQRTGKSLTIDNIKIIEITDDTNLPRINYEGFSFDGSGNIIPGSGCGSWLWEHQSTNLVPYSSDLLNWINSGGNTLTSGLTSPSGESDAFSILSGTGTSSRLIYTTTLSATETQHTLSAFVKQVNGFNTAYLRWGSSELAANIVSFAFDTETLTNLGGNTTDLFVKNFANGWYRIGFTFTTGTAITNQGLQINRGSSVDAAYWGIQVEQQSYATSYIPTDGTQKTRNKDVCTNGGSISTINSTEGVLYAEIAKNNGDTGSTVVSLNDGSTSDTVAFYYFSTNQVYFDILSSSPTVSQGFAISNASDFNKIALKYKSNDIALWINGVEVFTGTNTITLSGLNSLDFAYGSGSFPFYGKTKALAVFPFLTDTELAELTTI